MFATELWAHFSEFAPSSFFWGIKTIEELFHYFHYLRKTIIGFSFTTKDFMPAFISFACFCVQHVARAIR